VKIPEIIRRYPSGKWNAAGKRWLAAAAAAAAAADCPSVPRDSRVPLYAKGRWASVGVTGIGGRAGERG